MEGYSPSSEACARYFSETKTCLSVSSKADHSGAKLVLPDSSEASFNNKHAALSPSVTTGT